MCDSDDTGWRLIAGYTPHEIEEMEAIVRHAHDERDAEAEQRLERAKEDAALN